MIILISFLEICAVIWGIILASIAVRFIWACATELIKGLIKELEDRHF